ncbi:MAG: hypothetical protein CME87_25655 [Herbaspirillum sp.]|nr:hypothetical protein [Herbaspirillum sp.]
MSFEIVDDWDFDTAIDLEDYHVPCEDLRREAHAMAHAHAGRPPVSHSDQGYPLPGGGRCWVTDHRARKWGRRPSVTVVIRIGGKEGVGTYTW